MDFYYTRISTVKQSANRQIENFKLLSGFSAENLYVDKIDGATPFLNRPAALELYDEIISNHNDATIVVDSIDRLGRNLLDILNTIELFKKNKINLKSIKEGFETIIDGKENVIANIVIAVMGSIAEMEKNRIKERTAEGIKIAQAKGKFKGRKRGSVQTDAKLLRRHQLTVRHLKKGTTIRDISTITGNSSTTILKVKKVLKKQNLLN